MGFHVFICMVGLFVFIYLFGLHSCVDSLRLIICSRDLRYYQVSLDYEWLKKLFCVLSVCCLCVLCGIG